MFIKIVIHTHSLKKLTDEELEARRLKNRISYEKHKEKRRAEKRIYNKKNAKSIAKKMAKHRVDEPEAGHPLLGKTKLFGSGSHTIRQIHRPIFLQRQYPEPV